MKPSKQCYDLIKEFEGFYPDAYPDPGTKNDPVKRGEPITIGWGTTEYNAAGVLKYGRGKVKIGDTLTRAQADNELAYEVQRIGTRVYDINDKLNQNQFDSVVSFFYNAGFPQPQVERLRQGWLAEFADTALEYINKGTAVEAGLRRRRKAEWELFYKPVTEEKRMKPFGDWYLINKNGVWEMLGAKYVDKIAMAQPLTLSSKIFNGHNLIVNWERADPEPYTVAPKPVDYSIAKLTRYTTAQKMNSAWTNAGLKPLKLEIGDEEFLVVSGQGYAQNFRKFNDPRSRPGNMEPIPEGSYAIEDIAWASGKDNYNGTFGEGLGPVWVGLPAQQIMARSAFGIHIDQNMSRAPGSAGCVVLESVEQAKAVVAALRKFDPKTLVVSYS
jgi:GH24 family phage-related lysozyme (muramidase)